MGRLFVITLSGKIYSCKHCHTHFALADDILSKSFQCHNGRAYLFDKVVNVTVGEREGRKMTTGMHIVCDIYCVGCGSVVGWKYEVADEEDQKYKEGKFILERFKVIDPNGNGYMIDEEPLVGDSEGDD